jgi:hypothetical protein
MKGLMTSIRELVAADGEAYLGPGPNDVCAWPECGNEPTWETECEDLESAGTVANGDRSELVVSKNVRWYCDEHARRICFEENLELPAKLSLDI